MPEQFVGAVDQVNVHGFTWPIIVDSHSLNLVKTAFSNAALRLCLGYPWQVADARTIPSGFSRLSVDGERLLFRLRQLGNTGRNSAGQLTRLAASDEDKLGRDLLVSWLQAAGLSVIVDAIGNIFGSWGDVNAGGALMLGSHIDTVVNAGIYDGPYGVLSVLVDREGSLWIGTRSAGLVQIMDRTLDTGAVPAVLDGVEVSSVCPRSCRERERRKNREDNRRELRGELSSGDAGRRKRQRSHAERKHRDADDRCQCAPHDEQPADQIDVRNDF